MVPGALGIVEIQTLLPGCGLGGNHTLEVMARKQREGVSPQDLGLIAQRAPYPQMMRKAKDLPEPKILCSDTGARE